VSVADVYCENIFQSVGHAETFCTPLTLTLQLGTRSLQLRFCIIKNFQSGVWLSCFTTFCEYGMRTKCNNQIVDCTPEIASCYETCESWL